MVVAPAANEERSSIGNALAFMQAFAIDFLTRVGQETKSPKSRHMRRQLQVVDPATHVRKQILQPSSGEAVPGEIVAIIGPSGAGVFVSFLLEA